MEKNQNRNNSSWHMKIKLNENFSVCRCSYYWNTSINNRLHIICDCFYTTSAGLSSCNTNKMANKVQNTYNRATHREFANLDQDFRFSNFVCIQITKGIFWKYRFWLPGPEILHFKQAPGDVNAAGPWTPLWVAKPWMTTSM